MKTTIKSTADIKQLMSEMGQSVIYFKSAAVTKLKEYTRSYGGQEVVTIKYGVLTISGKTGYLNGLQVDAKKFIQAEIEVCSELAWKRYHNSLRRKSIKAKADADKARIEATLKWQEEMKRVKSILDPMIPAFEADGVELKSTCKGSRSCAFFIRGKYADKLGAITQGQVRDWLRLPR